MAKMGYVHGSGLGKEGEGRIEPVEAMVFPPGRSLGKSIIFFLFLEIPENWFVIPDLVFVF